MTTYGTARLRRSLNNQCSAGETAYTMELDAMEDLVREVEDERDGLIGKCDYWMGRCAELMEPDSWERVERDACATERERDLVARCKRLAGVE